MSAIATCQRPGSLENLLACLLAIAGEARSSEVPLGDDDDAHAVAQTLNGDREAFGRLVERHQRSITAQMFRFSRNAAIVEELVHEVFVEAFLSLRSYRRRAPLVHWLRKIAVRRGYRHWKERDSRPLVPLEQSIEALARPGALEAAEANEAFFALLAPLEPRDRLVLTLLYWEGLSAGETARLAGWTTTLVRVQAFRARRRLRALMERGQP